MIKIVTDSVASIPADVVRERDIEVVSLYVNRDGREYRETDMDVDAFYEDIYDMIEQPPTSSQPSLHALEAIFDRAAEARDEVLGIFLSSKMSGTFESAVSSARACKERYEQFRCTLVDSTSNCGDEMFAVLDAADARDNGADLEGCAAAVAASHVAAVSSETHLFMDFAVCSERCKKRAKEGAKEIDGGSPRPIRDAACEGTHASLARAAGLREAKLRPAALSREPVQKRHLRRIRQFVKTAVGARRSCGPPIPDGIEPFGGQRRSLLGTKPAEGTHSQELRASAAGGFGPPTSSTSNGTRLSRVFRPRIAAFILFERTDAR